MFASMFLFSFAMSITPGPVNTVILSTSLNHGLKRSLPYISGATIGFTLLLIFMAFGLQSVLTQFPFVLKILAVCGTLFCLLYRHKNYSFCCQYFNFKCTCRAHAYSQF